jgi:hypothetical protein
LEHNLHLATQCPHLLEIDFRKVLSGKFDGAGCWFDEA